MLHFLDPIMEVFTMRITNKTILTSKWEIPHLKGYGMGNTLIYITTKSHCVPFNMWNSMEYEKDCSLTFNYCTLVVWTNMVLLIHKESKSVNEFIRVL